MMEASQMTALKFGRIKMGKCFHVRRSKSQKLVKQRLGKFRVVESTWMAATSQGDNAGFGAKGRPNHFKNGGDTVRQAVKGMNQDAQRPE